MYIFPEKGIRQLAGPVMPKEKKATRQKQAVLKEKKAIKCK